MAIGFSAIFLLTFCGKPNESESVVKEETDSMSIEKPFRLTLKQAANLAELPLACMQVEYPNKLSQTLGGKEDIREPHELHPSFYGVSTGIPRFMGTGHWSDC